jgi:hypothetical protein
MQASIAVITLFAPETLMLLMLKYLLRAILNKASPVCSTTNNTQSVNDPGPAPNLIPSIAPMSIHFLPTVPATLVKVVQSAAVLQEYFTAQKFCHLSKCYQTVIGGIKGYYFQGDKT